MKLNLPQEKINEILDSLAKINAAVYKPNAFTSYFFTYREIEKGISVFDQFVLKVQEVEFKLAEELKEKGKQTGYKMAVLCRDRDLKPSIENGKILYMYFFTNNKYFSSIPDEIIKDEDQSSVEQRVVNIEV